MKGKTMALFVIFIVIVTVVASPMVSKEGCYTTVSVDEDIAGQKMCMLFDAGSNEVVYVDDNNTMGPWDGTREHPYQYIQEGINASDERNTVFVYNGTYKEKIAINKSLVVTGESQENTLIDGSYTETIIHIISDDVVLRNFTLRNSGGSRGNAGVKCDSNGAAIENCSISRTKTGVWVHARLDTEITNCFFYSNGEGIFLQGSENTRIRGCSFVHNAMGAHLETTVNTLITFCCFHTNGFACFLNDSINIDIVQCNVSDNSDNHGGVMTTNCAVVNITNSRLLHNGMGVYVADTHSLAITDCDVEWNTHFGLLFHQSSTGIFVSHCEIQNNKRFGLYVVDNTLCTITNSNIDNNMLYGVYAKDSQCIAQGNWWGSFFGPSFIELGLGDRITGHYRQVQYIPWSVTAFETIGTDWEEELPCPNLDYPMRRFESLDLPGDDTDGDGVPDWWEDLYGYNPVVWENHEVLDPDDDGLNNIEECYTFEWGSHPFQKDIFLEIDWVEPQNTGGPTNKPPSDLVQQLQTIFAQHNIILHIDTGELGGGEEIPYISHFSFADLRDLYWEYFLHGDLNNPRKGIFHYGIVCDYGPDVNFPFVGWDHFDSFLISAQWLQDQHPLLRRGRLIVGGTAHQLGSTLGLLVDTHGGNDNLLASVLFTLQWWKYKNYRSCMNYYYKYKRFSYSDGTHGRGDFDDWANLNLGFFKNSHFTIS